MNTYNVMINYEGDGSTNIFIPQVGDTVVTNGRQLYIKNAPFNVIEALRQYREMMISIQLNAKQKGAFRVIDFSEIQPIKRLINERPEVTHEVPDISSVLSSGQNGPIPTIEPIKEQDYGAYVLKSGSYEGKSLREVDELGKLKQVYNGFKSRNPEVKEAIEKYYQSQVE